MPYRLTATAEADLLEIGNFIAADNPRAAAKLLRDIDKACALLGEGPMLGRARPEIATGARSWPVGRYLVLYRPLDSGIEIVRIVHGARRLHRILD